ncbi:hypothetical protein ACVBEH_07800 [Roseateles sp. GG27B]
MLPQPLVLAEGGTAISRPFIDPLTQQSVIALAIRFAAPPGHADGWILAALPAKVLLGAFAAAAPAADASIAVQRSDGEHLAGTPLRLMDSQDAAVETGPGPDIKLRRFSDGGEELLAQYSVPRYGCGWWCHAASGAVLTGWRGAAS